MAAPDQRLAGRTGLITGAASGIGAAGADLFAAHGAALVLLDQDRAGGQRVADTITARGGRAVFQPGDAASPDDVAGAVRAAVRHCTGAAAAGSRSAPRPGWPGCAATGRTCGRPRAG